MNYSINKLIYLLKIKELFGNWKLSRSTAADNAYSAKDQDKDSEADTVPSKARECMLSDESTACESIIFFEKNKENREEVFSIILSFVRDVLYKKLGIDNVLINTDKINYINAFKDKANAKAFCKMMKIILDTQIQKGKNGNYTIAIATTLFKCREELNGRSNRNTL